MTVLQFLPHRFFLFGLTLGLIATAHYSSAIPVTVDEVIPLTEITGNLSGITYNKDTQTYFLIRNNSGQIFEYDRTFSKALRIIKMINLKDKDTEDLVYLGQGRYAMSTEENFVFIFSIAKGQTQVDLDSSRADVQEFRLPPPKKDNKGLEGVCFTPQSPSQSPQDRGTFYAVQEQRPKVLYAFGWPRSEADFASPRSFNLKEPFDTNALMKHRLSDLSACTVDPRTKNLLILSDESSRLMVLSPLGQILKILDLPTVAPQYEGVTFGENQELILVSEPNIVVILKNPL